MNRIVYECKDNMCEFSFKKKFQFCIYISIQLHCISHIFAKIQFQNLELHTLVFLVHEAQFNVKFENHMSMG